MPIGNSSGLPGLSSTVRLTNTTATEASVSLILTSAIDDIPVLVAARQEARQNFEKNRRPAVDTGMQINHAIEVANILRHNIVQGSRPQGDEAAKWGMCFINHAISLCSLVLIVLIPTVY